MNTRGRGLIHCERAFTWLELLVVIAVPAVLGVLFSPVLINNHSKARRVVCFSNLSQIGLSFRLFASDHAGQYPWQLDRDLSGARDAMSAEVLWRTLRSASNSISEPNILICPADTRKPATILQPLTPSNLSYFIGLDACGAFPQAPLAGDRNLTTNGVPVGSGLVNLTTNLTLGWTQASTIAPATWCWATAACRFSHRFVA